MLELPDNSIDHLTLWCKTLKVVKIMFVSTMDKSALQTWSLLPSLIHIILQLVWVICGFCSSGQAIWHIPEGPRALTLGYYKAYIFGTLD